MNDCSFTNNTATGGIGNNNGQGKGGAIFLVTPALAGAAGVSTAPNLVEQGTNTFSGNTAANQAGTAGDNNDVYGLTTPRVTQQPSSQTDDALSTVSFSAAASGNPAPSVQWQVSSDRGATFHSINGATSTMLTLTATGDMTGNEYEASFMNQAGGATTSPATLTVIPLTTTVTGVNPVDITYGTAVDDSQLSGAATATVGGQTVSVPGTFIYTTAAGVLSRRSMARSRMLLWRYPPSTTTAPQP